MLGVVVDGVVIPEGIKGTHRGGGLGDSELDVVIVAQRVRDVSSEVLEVICEGDAAKLPDGNYFRLLCFIIQTIVPFPFCLFNFLLQFGDNRKGRRGVGWKSS